MKIPKKLPPPPPPPPSSDIDRLAKLINDHPFPSLHHHLLPPLLSSPSLLPSLLSRLFLSHSHSLKALHLFQFSLLHLPHPPSSTSLETTLHILTRSRHFPLAFSLLHQIAHSPHSSSLLTPKSLSILLSRLAKFRSFPETLSAFERAELLWAHAGLQFGVDEFNSLLRSFSSQGRMAEARAVFNRFHSKFSPNSKTLNTLLLGFRESGNLLAFDLFYHDMINRGFDPDVVTYNIRIDAYCKKNRFFMALELLDEMEKNNLSPTVETMTTLIHGAGIVRNPFRARRLFDEISDRGISPDRGAYNALMGSLVKAGDLKGGLKLMDEMGEKGIGVDDVSYYTLFCGLKRVGDLEGVCNLYRKMGERSCVPRPRTVMLLMKYFCENRRLDLGLELWDFMVEKGCCPHRHALDLLATGLCCGGRVAEAFERFKQVVERGRQPSESSFRLLEGVLVRSREREKLEELKVMMERLESLEVREAV